MDNRASHDSQMDEDVIETSDINHLNNFAIFRPIGVMYPTMTFGQLRSPIYFVKTNELVRKVYNIAGMIRGFSYNNNRIINNSTIDGITESLKEIVD